MASIATLSSSLREFTNTSVATASTSLTCNSCLGFEVDANLNAVWTRSFPFREFPPLRTVQTVIDPNINTTYLTTFGCNTAALSEYNNYTTGRTYRVDHDCNLIGVFNWHAQTVTVTLDVSTQSRYGFGSTAYLHTFVPTTYEDGSSACAWTGSYITLDPPNLTYPGPVEILNLTLPNFVMVFPGLLSYLPGMSAASNCPHGATGGSPMALEPVNFLTESTPRIVPLTSNNAIEATPTSAAPGSTAAPNVPATTTSRVDTTTNDQVPSVPSATSLGSAPAASTIPEEGPFESSAEPDPSSPSAIAHTQSTGTNGPLANDSLDDDAPNASTVPSDGPSPPPVASAAPESVSPTPGTLTPSSLSASGQATDPSPGTSAGSAAGNSPGASNDPIVPIEATTTRLGSSIAGGIGISSTADVPAISVVSSNPNVVVVDNSVSISAGGTALTTSGRVISALPSGAGVVVSPVALGEVVVLEESISLTAGGVAATISGAIYTVLPSGQGVQLVSAGRTTTVAIDRPGESVSQIGGILVSVLRAPATTISPASTFVLGGTATLSLGGSAVTISGVVYTALPSGQGVQIVSAGRTTTVAIGRPGHSMTRIGGLDISILDTAATTISPASVFVLGGSATLSVGGSAVTVSGVLYTLLPSNFVEIVSGTVTAYEIAGQATLAPGQETAISGVVYKALPSGGVVVVAGGTTEIVTAATGPQTVAPYTGDASGVRGGLWIVTGAVILAMVVLFVASL